MSNYIKISGLFALFLAALAPSPLFAETVTVDMSVSQGAQTYAGSGFLHGMTLTTPSSSVIDPLKPKMLRCTEWSQCFQLYPRAQALGAKVQFVLSDSFTYRAPWPGDNGDWSAWLSTVSRIVTQAVANGQTFQWDLWNEPDAAYFWGRSPEQFVETWRRTYLQVRAIDPNATIVGPSLSRYTGKDFLLYAKANNVLPTVLSWHAFDGPLRLAQDVADIRQFMAANDISIPRISINEYIPPLENYAPGPLVGYLAAIGRSGVESAAHACWPDEGGISNCNNYSLDGVLTTTDKLPRPQWWVYKGYADITGTLVGVTPGATVDAVAGRDSGSKTARIVLGRNDPSSTTSATIETLIKNISASAPYLINGGKVHVVAKRIPAMGYASLPSPLTLIDADYPVSNDQISVFLNNFLPQDAYTVSLSAPGATTIEPPPAPRDLQPLLRGAGPGAVGRAAGAVRAPGHRRAGEMRRK